MELWQCRFGHEEIDNISKLFNKNMVEGMSSAKDGVPYMCSICHEKVKESELFEVVHSDVCGPMNVQSFGKSQYYVTFIDEYSRYTQMYFLKSKDGV